MRSSRARSSIIAFASLIWPNIRAAFVRRFSTIISTSPTSRVRMSKSLIAERGYLRIVDHENYNPRLIEYLTNLAWIGETPSAGYLGLFLRNLDNPVEIWGHAFRSQLSVRARNLLFVLITMPLESHRRNGWSKHSPSSTVHSVPNSVLRAPRRIFLGMH